MIIKVGGASTGAACVELCPFRARTPLRFAALQDKLGRAASAYGLSPLFVT